MSFSFLSIYWEECKLLLEWERRSSRFNDFIHDTSSTVFSSDRMATFLETQNSYSNKALRTWTPIDAFKKSIIFSPVSAHKHSVRSDCAPVILLIIVTVVSIYRIKIQKFSSTHVSRSINNRVKNFVRQCYWNYCKGKYSRLLFCKI